MKHAGSRRLTSESVSIDRDDTLSSAQKPHARKNQFRELAPLSHPRSGEKGGTCGAADGSSAGAKE